MTDASKARRETREISHSFFIALFLLACCARAAQNDGHRVRNIVLVHGAWADGSGWRGVYDILVKDGYNVNIVQEPETSFKGEEGSDRRRTGYSRMRTGSSATQNYPRISAS